MTNTLLSKNSCSNKAVTKTDDPRILALQKAYSADQQVKYLHLEAEIDVLLQQLKILNK